MFQRLKTIYFTWCIVLSIISCHNVYKIHKQDDSHDCEDKYVALLGEPNIENVRLNPYMIYHIDYDIVLHRSLRYYDSYWKKKIVSKMYKITNIWPYFSKLSSKYELIFRFCFEEDDAKIFHYASTIKLPKNGFWKENYTIVNISHSIEGLKNRFINEKIDIILYESNKELDLRFDKTILGKPYRERILPIIQKILDKDPFVKMKQNIGALRINLFVKNVLK